MKFPQALMPWPESQAQFLPVNSSGAKIVTLRASVNLAKESSSACWVSLDCRLLWHRGGCWGTPSLNQFMHRASGTSCPPRAHWELWGDKLEPCQRTTAALPERLRADTYASCDLMDVKIELDYYKCFPRALLSVLSHSSSSLPLQFPVPTPTKFNLQQPVDTQRVKIPKESKH